MDNYNSCEAFSLQSFNYTYFSFFRHTQRMACVTAVYLLNSIYSDKEGACAIRKQNGIYKRDDHTELTAKPTSWLKFFNIAISKLNVQQKNTKRSYSINIQKTQKQLAVHFWQELYDIDWVNSSVLDYDDNIFQKKKQIDDLKGKNLTKTVS